MKDENYVQRKQMILSLMADKDYNPMKIKEIAILLQVPLNDRERLVAVLNDLVNEDKITVNNRGKYALSKEAIDVIIGTYEGHHKGFGFVVIEGEEEDIFVSPNNTNGALHKDTVQVKIISSPSGKRKEGEVTKIIEHGMKEVIGSFEKNKNFGFVVSDNTKFSKDIFIPKELDMGAVSGHKVVVQILDYGNGRRNPEGRIKEIIGHINDPGTDIMAIVKAFGLPNEFSDELMQSIDKIPSTVTEEARKDRLDIRDLITVTIDGEDAKDLDDAITISREGTHYRLGVHIADVTHYVRENELLDEEALLRGTSVYLVDRVIPMLPHKLSNGICSLNQGEDRLALTCFMDIDEKGNVVGHQIAETVICVNERMTYTSVKKILEDKDEDERVKYHSLIPMFELMEELALLLRRKRKKRGSIDFDFIESKIILDKKGRPIDIKPYERNIATKIIEEFMLLANETVAEDFFWQEAPFVYRSHEVPDPDKIRKLGTFIYNFGYRLRSKSEELHPKELQKLLTEIEGKPEEPLISRLALRSLKQAKYTVHSDGHFGLATKYYCHFTSPIRRYPDLQIHRIIKENIKGKLKEKRITHYASILPEVAKHSSETERRADEAERETDKLKKVEYMSKYIGEIFEGVISSVTSWGMYVELPNTVEGLVRINSIQDDYYHYNEQNYTLVGERTNRIFHLGDRIKIEVVGTDKIQRTIDFELAEEDEE